MPRKTKKLALIRIHFVAIIIGFVLALGLFYSTYSTYNYDVQAVPRYDLKVITPRDEIRNGGELLFGIDLAQYRAGENLQIGAKYDGRKLRLDGVDSGIVGEVSWNAIEDEGDEHRIIVTANPVNQDYDASVRFAVLRFTITDDTGETNADGRGFTEICTLFNPQTPQPTQRPTVASTDPTTQPTAVPTEVASNPSVQAPPGGLLVTPTLPPQPTVLPNQSKDRLCIPLNVNGSPADKMDIVIIPANFSPDQLDTFLQYAQAAVDDLRKTNLINYENEILNKMNWYAFNHVQYENRTLSPEEAFTEIGMRQRPCAADRFMVIRHSDPQEIEGWAYLYIGGMVSSGSLRYYLPIVTHEWGHFVGGLTDEYDAGRAGSEAPNCTTDQGILVSRLDPCPGNQALCPDEQMPAANRVACPKWDCTKRNCTPLEEEMFRNVGCYPRCYNSEGYRPRPKSIMDSHMAGAPDNFVFHGPALVHLIQQVFARYR